MVFQNAQRMNYYTDNARPGDSGRNRSILRQAQYDNEPVCTTWLVGGQTVLE